MLSDIITSPSEIGKALLQQFQARSSYRQMAAELNLPKPISFPDISHCKFDHRQKRSTNRIRLSPKYHHPRPNSFGIVVNGFDYFSWNSNIR